MSKRIPPFIHVHNHSQYSKFDGFCSVKDLVKKAKEFNMPAVGLTDHGTFAGALNMLKTCRSEGIKPILGMEAYLARDHCCRDKEGQPDGRKGNRHINVIAKNVEGFKNVCALSQEASLNGYYYDPRIDYELLNKYKEGLIVTSACLSNIININLLMDNYKEAKKAASLFKDIFADDFYLEMMFHGITSEGKVLPLIQKLGKELNIKILATNDVHYPEQSDAEFQEVLMCMSSGRCLKDPSRIAFPYKEFYFKSPEEMYKVFKTIPYAMSNTLEIADKCDYSDIIFVQDGGEMRLPTFPIPEDQAGPIPYLEKLAHEGLSKLGLGESEAHVDRLNRELDDIKLIWNTKKYDFATYFLLVDDIMKYAKEQNIAAGIRGSGYGSVLLKALGITEGVDPLEYDLLWERFLGFDDKYFFCEDDFGIEAA